MSNTHSGWMKHDEVKPTHCTQNLLRTFYLKTGLSIALISTRTWTFALQICGNTRHTQAVNRNKSNYYARHTLLKKCEKTKKTN